jgi:anaerobic magnesium-protoporphyrin IX monomethyl ester cyclase
VGLNVILCFCRTDIPMELACPSGGILMLAAMLEAGGRHSAEVVLAAEYPAFRADLERRLSRCDVLGVSSTSYNWYVARELIAAARRTKRVVTIVLGGVHPTHLADHCLTSTAADVVVRGEGELTFPALLDAIDRGGDLGRIAGITFKGEDGRINSTPDRPPLPDAELEKLPLPAYHLIPPGVYSHVPIEGSRGCAFDCAFCGIAQRRNHRALSAARVATVVARLRSLEDRFLARSVFFTDDSFGTRKPEARGQLEALAPTGWLIGMEARYHDLLHPQLVEAIDSNRFYLIQVGVETGYQAGIGKVDKKLELADVFRFAEAMARRPIRAAIQYSLACGLPWESEAHVLATINAGYELATRSASAPPMLNNFNPLPGSHMVARPEAFGLPPLRPEFWDDHGWFRPFLGFARIPPVNRQFLRRYIELRRALHPALPNAPLLQFPDGKLLANAVWDTESLAMRA